MRLAFEVKGDVELIDVLERLDDFLSTTIVLDESAAILLDHTRKRFLQQVDPNGDPWIPSISSILRAKRGRGGGTLFDTGNLFHSLQLYASGISEREIGTDVEYGVHHQHGTDGLPKRQFLGINDHDIRVMVGNIRKHVEDIINGR